MFKHIFSLAIVALFATIVSSAASKKKQIEACDAGPHDHEYTSNGVGFKWNTPDDKVYYLNAEQSACGPTYTDFSNVVCVSSGYINHAKVSHCNNWVQLFNPKNGVTAQGYVLDSCDGDDPNSTFGCNDIYVSLGLFKKLAGSQEKEAIARGDLGGPINWRYIEQPCWAAYAGLPGTLLNGKQDPAQGPDFEGNLRCGRKHGGERIVGPSAAQVCNKGIKNCAQANKIAATLPKYKGSSEGVAQPNVVAFNAQGKPV